MRFMELVTESVGSGQIDKFVSEIIAKYGLKSLNMFLDSSGRLEIGMIAVDRDKMGSGVGTQAMQEITDFADRHNLVMVLSPALKDKNFGTTSQSRLIKFYKRFGFVQNKGRNKDYSISRSMYRTPR